MTHLLSGMYTHVSRYTGTIRIVNADSERFPPREISCHPSKVCQGEMWQPFPSSSTSSSSSSAAREIGEERQRPRHQQQEEQGHDWVHYCQCALRGKIKAKLNTYNPLIPHHHHQSTFSPPIPSSLPQASTTIFHGPTHHPPPPPY